MSTWKYRTATLKAGMTKYHWKDEGLQDLSIDEGLNKLGHDGWELAATAPYSGSGTVTETIYIFKKQY